MFYSTDEVYSDKEGLLNTLFECIDDQRLKDKETWNSICIDCYNTLGEKGLEIFKDHCLSVELDRDEDIEHLNKEFMSFLIQEVLEDVKSPIPSSTPVMQMHNKIKARDSASVFIRYAFEDNHKRIMMWMAENSYTYLTRVLIDMVSHTRIESKSDFYAIGSVLNRIRGGLDIFKTYTLRSLRQYKKIPETFTSLYRIDNDTKKKLDDFVEWLHDCESISEEDYREEFQRLVPNTFRATNQMGDYNYLSKKLKTFRSKEHYRRFVYNKYYTDPDIVDYVCKAVFDSIRITEDSPLTVATLGWFAKNDRPKEYQRWMNVRVKEAVVNSVTNFDFDICKAFYTLFWLDFKYDSEDSTWYSFNGRYWKKEKNSIKIKYVMANEFKVLYQTQLNSVIESKNMIDDSDEEGESEMHILKELEKACKSIIKTLSSDAGKSKLIRELTIFYSDSKFSEYIDSNMNVLSIKNGVLEFYTDGSFEFRGSKPEDYLTFCAPSQYIEYSDDHEYVMYIRNWIKQIIREDETEQYLIRFLSSFLCGRNKEKIFSIWTGATNNSKSSLGNLIRKTLGKKYCGNVEPIELCSVKGQKGRASSELMAIRGSNVVISSEPSEGEELSCSMIKKFTGGVDTITARELHKEAVEFLPRFRLLLLTNNIPKMDTIDDAIKMRTHIVPFRSTWLPRDEYKKMMLSEEEMAERGFFLQDPDLNDKLDRYIDAFLWFLCDNYRNYVEHGLKPTELMIEENNKYWVSSDIVFEFLNQSLRDIVPDSTDTEVVLNVDFYQEYLAWLKNMGYLKKRLTQQKFIEEIKTKKRFTVTTRDDNKCVIVGKCLA